MRMQKCTRCSRTLSLRSVVCPGCLSRSFEVLDLPDAGRLVSWTTIRRAPAGFHVTAPYDVVVVDVEPGVRVTGRLTADSAAARLDATVRIVEMDNGSPVFAVTAA